MTPAANHLPVEADRAAGVAVRAISCSLILISIGAACAVTPAISQIAPQIEGPINTSSNARMVLEANELVYDFDNEIVSAIGGVEIHYDGYTVEADKVTYYQRSGRLIASGGVRIVEPDGNIVTGSQTDITDDLRDGFVENINVQTVGRARFAARSAERPRSLSTSRKKRSITRMPRWNSMAFPSPGCRSSSIPIRRSSAKPVFCNPISAMPMRWDFLRRHRSFGTLRPTRTSHSSRRFIASRAFWVRWSGVSG
jgi:hypothetical protein